MRLKMFLTVSFIVVLALFLFVGAEKPGSSKVKGAQIAHGKYLVMIGGCEDCHSPKVFGPMGPMPDSTRTLSGHPADYKMPEVPKDLIAPDKWGALTTNDLTAWVGPWGTSFTRNLTPDKATGLGSWTEAMFIKALRTGKDMGEGRDILPPMPWQTIGQMKDQDLKDIFAYLQSLPPISNAIPDPIPPAGAPKK